MDTMCQKLKDKDIDSIDIQEFIDQFILHPELCIGERPIMDRLEYNCRRYNLEIDKYVKGVVVRKDE